MNWLVGGRWSVVLVFGLRARGLVHFLLSASASLFGYALGPEQGQSSDWGCPLMLRGDLKLKDLWMDKR